jgi:alkanesulfonate monooxygenase SsuD/methylene tetrahydromethanopterin reductase-like flavin-dependent oxidoreductase (luciferase family)
MEIDIKKVDVTKVAAARNLAQNALEALETVMPAFKEYERRAKKSGNENIYFLATACVSLATQARALAISLRYLSNSLILKG